MTAPDIYTNLFEEPSCPECGEVAEECETCKGHGSIVTGRSWNNEGVEQCPRCRGDCYICPACGPPEY